MNHLRRHGALLPILALALVLRLALWENLPRTGFISDEGEYLSAADWLANGRGFAWYQGYLWTRAPLYPLFLAAHLHLFGPALEPIYFTQMLLSLLNIVLAYVLARRLLPEYPAVAALAALLMGVFFPFAVYPQTLLSETLFLTLLLTMFVCLSGAIDRQPLRTQLLFAAAAGIALGLAILTRSLMLGFVPVVVGWMFWHLRGSTGYQQATAAGSTEPHAGPRATRGYGRFWPVLVLLSASALVVLPWTITNSRWYGGLVLVDTSGAFNLLLGARTAYDGGRSDQPVRDFVLGLFPQGRPAEAPQHCAPYPGPLPNQAARQAAMTREALCLIAADPGAFVRKSLLELIDLFQINYTGAERFTNGFTTGRLPTAYSLGLLLLDDTLYVVTLPLALLGWIALRATPTVRQALLVLLGLWLLYNLAAAPLLFAINRFRLPLIPILFILAAGFLVCRQQIRPAAIRASRMRRAAYYLVTVLVAVVATTPYAVIWPHLASYFGPDIPGSIASTRVAVQARPAWEHAERLQAALRAGKTDAAERLLAEPLPNDVRRLAPALLAGVRGNPVAGLALLPDPEMAAANNDALASVVRGDLLRSLGDDAGARAAFTPTFVDNANPVQWAWDWLSPTATTRIDLGGNLDLGYIAGCFLGEGDPSGGGTFRWCGDGARLRFVGAGSGAPQTLLLRVDGRGWPRDLLPAPPIRVELGGQTVGQFTPDPNGVVVVMVPLPPMVPDADVVLTLRGASFVDGPERYLSQQGRAAVGQVQRLAVRLDWAEVR